MTSNQTPAGWRDMKDAPRDGTQIALRIKSHLNSEIYKAHYSRDDGGWVAGNFVVHAPKRLMGWLPLPNPDTGFAPVVTEEMVYELARQLWSWNTGGTPEYWDNGSDDSPSDEEAERFMMMARDTLTAALPHAKTEAQVEDALLERLIAEAGKRRIIHVHRGAVTLKYETSSAGDVDSLADWLLARKGKSDG